MTSLFNHRPKQIPLPTIANKKTHKGDPGQTANTTDTMLQLMTNWPGPAPRGGNWNTGGIDALVIAGDMPCVCFFLGCVFFCARLVWGG
jgi:hypothetical protein